MENTNKMNRLTNDMKAFEQLMKEKRTKDQFPAIEVEIEDEESPAAILLQASGMLLDCSLMVAKAAFLVGIMESEAEDEDEDDDDDECGKCPYEGKCGSDYGTMVLVARPNGDNTIMTLDEFADEIGDLALGQTGTYDMKPVPGSEDLYYTIPEKKPMKRSGKTFYKAPAVIFGIDEDAGEIVSPNARQLYTAARYFEDASKTIRTREGDTAVFCFD